jgi:pimeloyl-ACP methyl ester carboxylesterase
MNAAREGMLDDATEDCWLLPSPYRDLFYPSMKPTRMLWIILTIAASVYASLCLFFFVFQRSFIYMPTPATPTHDVAAVLEVADARLRLSTRPLDGPKALIYFGGNAEDVASTLPELAAAFPDRAIYALHYRGYSGSTGHPAEAAMRNDARTLFQMVHDRHPDVTAVGRSLGSSLAIQLAAEGGISRLVLIAPFKSILAIASRVAPFLPMRLLLRDPWQSWRYAPRVTCPTLILAASHDEIVPMSDTEELFEAFRPGVATLRVIDGTDHNSVSGPEEFWEALVEKRTESS